MRFWSRYVQMVEGLMVIGTIALLIVAVLQVFFRYVIGASLFWSEELMRYLMIFVVAVGSGLTYSRGELLGMRMLIEVFPAPVTRLFDLAGSVLAAIFCGAIAWHGWDFAERTAAAHSPALQFGMFWVHGMIALASLLLLVHLILGGVLSLSFARPRHERDPVDEVQA